MAITCLNKPVVFLQIKRIRALCGQQLQKNDTKTWILKSPWKDSPRTNQKQKRLWGTLALSNTWLFSLTPSVHPVDTETVSRDFCIFTHPCWEHTATYFWKVETSCNNQSTNYYCFRLGMWQHARDLMLGTIITAFKTTCRAVVNTKFDTHSAHQPIKVRYLLIYCASL